MSNPWSHLLDKTITYQLRSGVGSYGDPTFAAQATCKARIDAKRVRAADRNTANSGVRWETATVIITDVALPLGSRVWLPGTDTGDVNDAVPVRKSMSSNLPGTSNTIYESML